MTYATINFYFYLTLFGGFFVGMIAVVLWARKIFPSLMEKIARDQNVSVSAIASRAFISMLPGLLLFALCCLPMFYFGNLLKQRGYCLQVVQTNKGITRDNPALLERCGQYDLDELFRDAGVTADD